MLIYDRVHIVHIVNHTEIDMHNIYIYINICVCVYILCIILEFKI